MGVMKATLILIGGGEIGNGETRPVDEKVRSYSSKENPHLLFLGPLQATREAIRRPSEAFMESLAARLSP